MAKSKIVAEDEYIDLSTSFALDNVCENKFNEESWKCGVKFASRYAAMYVSFRNCGIDEDSCVDLVKLVIEKELCRESE